MRLRDFAKLSPAEKRALATYRPVKMPPEIGISEEVLANLAKGRPVPSRMNKTEARYAELLETRKRAGKIRWWAFESMKFEIGVGAWYLPDFTLMLADGQLEVHETKGAFAREAALVRFKAAAQRYPLVFRWVVWKEGRWTVSDPYHEAQ